MYTRYVCILLLLLSAISIGIVRPADVSAHEGKHARSYIYDNKNRLTHVIPPSGYMNVYSYSENGSKSSINSAIAVSDNQFIKDVNGDGKADSVLFYSKDGAWYVSLSKGDLFGGYSKWVEGHGVGSKNQLLGDVNGDGMADAIVYFAEKGDWYVSISRGTFFDKYLKWIEGHGVASTNQLLGDVDGDKRLDSSIYFAMKGSWYVSISDGLQFKAYSKWVGIP